MPPKRAMTSRLLRQARTDNLGRGPGGGCRSDGTDRFSGGRASPANLRKPFETRHFLVAGLGGGVEPEAGPARTKQSRLVQEYWFSMWRTWFSVWFINLVNKIRSFMLYRFGGRVRWIEGWSSRKAGGRGRSAPMNHESLVPDRAGPHCATWGILRRRQANLGRANKPPEAT